MTPYHPTALLRHGPAANIYPGVNTCEGVILHSAEGRWSAAYKPEDTMRERKVSWHFTVRADGEIEQHYPLSASCWHAGSERQNKRLIGIEHEGKAGEALTAPQLASSVALVRWLRETCKWPSLTRGVTLYAHSDINPGTQCPSGRIPWEQYEGGIVAEVLPEAGLDDVAAFWAAVANPASRTDVDVDAIPASRQGWHAFRVEIMDYLK